MIKNYLLAFCLGASLHLINAQNMTLDAQRVGIGTNNPTEKLHVNGNLNISNGLLKTNGVAGQAGQILSVNNSGALAWTDFTDFKNFQTFAGFYINETNTTWTVPAGVTKILVEVWGGGAGGNKAGLGGGGSGGDSGGYTRGIIAVTPGQIASMVLGGGGVGLGPSYNSGNSGEPGHFSQLSVGTSVIQAKGGCYGCSAADIGDNFCSNCLSSFEIEGPPGIDHDDHFEQISSTEFVRNKNYGNGASPAFAPFNTSGLGERSYINLSTSAINIISLATPGMVPGGGGGGCSYTTGTNYPCGYGGAGMIIIRY